MSNSNNRFSGIEPAVANPFMTKTLCIEEYRQICTKLTQGPAGDYDKLVKYAGNAMEALKQKDLVELRAINAELKTL